MLRRRIFNHYFWQEDRVFSRAEAWLDLLQCAAVSPHKRLISGHSIEVPRGGIIASVRFLATRFKWSNTKVCLFLNVLESEGMIRREKRRETTLILLCNFEKYNPGKRWGNDVDGTQWRPQDDEIEKEKNQKLHRRRPAERRVCEEFCVSIGLPASDGAWFWEKCEGSGWRNGGHPIADWRMTIHAWKRAGYMASQKGIKLPASTIPLRLGEEATIWTPEAEFGEEVRP